MKTNYRYLVYSWDKDDLESYQEAYGEEMEIEPRFTSTITQFGTLVKETNDLNEANNACVKAQDRVGFYGMVSIFDTNEQEWFN